MHDKYTTVLTLAPAGAAVVPAGETYIAFSPYTNEVKEYPAGRSLTAPAPGFVQYSAPLAPYETLFAVTDAILCSKPNGAQFRPGMSLKLRFSFASALGLQKLLLLYKQRNGRVPECITMADVHALLIDDIRKICATAATNFSHNQVLAYTHWWNDLVYGQTYRDMIFTPLMQLFISYGLLLDKDGFAINGLAQMPVN